MSNANPALSLQTSNGTKLARVWSNRGPCRAEIRPSYLCTCRYLHLEKFKLRTLQLRCKMRMIE